MEFSDNRNIFLQIGEWIMDEIMKGNLIPGGRIPSVRELAEEMVVNRNTVNRTFTFLQEQEILENRRGMGYFVKDNAPQTIRKLRKEAFFSEQFPLFLEAVKQLELTEKDLAPLFKHLKRNSDESQ